MAKLDHGALGSSKYLCTTCESSFIGCAAPRGWVLSIPAWKGTAEFEVEPACSVFDLVPDLCLCVCVLPCLDFFDESGSSDLELGFE